MYFYHYFYYFVANTEVIGQTTLDSWVSKKMTTRKSLLLCIVICE